MSLFSFSLIFNTWFIGTAKSTLRQVLLTITSYSKSHRVFKTFLCNLADFNNAVVFIVLVLPLITNSSGLFSEHLETVPSAPTTIGITVTLMIHNFFSSLARSKHLSIFFFFFCFLLISVCGLLKLQNPLNSKFFYLCWLTLCLAFRPGLLGDPFVSQNLREFYECNFLGRILICAHTIW